MAKILKNTTGSAIVLNDCGLTLPALSSFTTTPGEWYTLSGSIEIDTLIDSGAIVINDGYDDLKPSLAKIHIHEESAPRASSFASLAEVRATAASTYTLTSASRGLIIFTGTTAGQILKLGDARTYNISGSYEIWNTATQEVVIQDNDGTNIFVLAVQQKTWVILQGNTTKAGTWLFEANFMGSGSSGGNALMSFGFDGTASSGRWLESLTNIASSTTGYTIAGSKTLRAFSIAGGTGSTYTATATIYKNGVALDTIGLAAQRKNSKLNLSHVLVNLDEVSAQVTSGSVARPVLVLWL